jgi:hypothetical protein
MTTAHTRPTSPSVSLVAMDAADEQIEQLLREAEERLSLKAAQRSNTEQVDEVSLEVYSKGGPIKYCPLSPKVQRSILIVLLQDTSATSWSPATAVCPICRWSCACRPVSPGSPRAKTASRQAEEN